MELEEEEERTSQSSPQRGPEGIATVGASWSKADGILVLFIGLGQMWGQGGKEFSH